MSFILSFPSITFSFEGKMFFHWSVLSSHILNAKRKTSGS